MLKTFGKLDLTIDEIEGVSEKKKLPSKPIILQIAAKDVVALTEKNIGKVQKVAG